MTLNYNENYAWIAPRLNTHIACAWGHAIASSPQAFLRSFLLYCSSGGSFMNTSKEASRQEIVKLLRYYSGDLDVDGELSSPFSDGDWRHWAFVLLNGALGLYEHSESRADEDYVSSDNLILYATCRNKFKELGVIE